jgi:hypothetical protein
VKLPGLGASPPKTPDVTPHAAKPDVKPTPDAGKPSNTPNDSGNGGSRATGNFSNVAQGTGALASGGSAIYRADQSTQNSQYGTQSTSGAVNYGGPAGSGTPSALQSQSPGQQSQALGNSGEQSMIAPLLQLLDKLIGAMLQPFGGGASAESAGGNPATSNAAAPAQVAAAKTEAPAANSEKDTSTKPTEATGRPKGDTRSADEIIAANPILANLGDQKDINREGAYKQVGDWTANNKDPEARADAAYNAARVLNYIDASHGAKGGDRGEMATNGDLEGITKSGDARHGTPAGNWKDFTEQGYGALKDDHRLDKTNDTHVTEKGGNKDNLPWAAGEAGKALWMIPGLSNVLTGVGESDGSLGGMIKGGVEGAVDTAKGAAEGMIGGGGNPAAMLAGAYAGALSESKAAPEEVRNVAGML